MKFEEIKELTDQEISERLQAEKNELLRLKLNHSISPLDNPSQIQATRRTIAQLSTALRQRELKK